MKIKKYTNGAWTDLDKPVKKFGTYTDTATTLPLTIEASATDAIENYQIFGASSGVGEETENLLDINGTWQMGTQTNTVSVNGKNVTITGQWYAYMIVPVKKNTNYHFDFSIVSSTAMSGASVYGVLNGAINNSDTVVSRQETPFAVATGEREQVALVMYSGYSTAGTSVYTDVMFTEGSTAPTTFIPFGYKIPISLQSGVTENVLIDNPYKTGYYINENGQETAQGGFNIYATETLDTSLGEYSFYFAEYRVNTTMRVHGYSNGVWQQQITTFANTHSATTTKPEGINEIRISCANGYTGRTLVKGSTPPSEYIPHRYESNYDLFIGDSKLGEEEYVDFESQKVYRYVDGVLTPVDPPVPLPPIPAYIGENSIDVDTTTAPDKVVVEYQGWKPAGEVKEYQSGEWSDNNGV